MVIDVNQVNEPLLCTFSSDLALFLRTQKYDHTQTAQTRTEQTKDLMGKTNSSARAFSNFLHYFSRPLQNINVK